MSASGRGSKRPSTTSPTNPQPSKRPRLLDDTCSSAVLGDVEGGSGLGVLGSRELLDVIPVATDETVAAIVTGLYAVQTLKEKQLLQKRAEFVEEFVARRNRLLESHRRRLTGILTTEPVERRNDAELEEFELECLEKQFDYDESVLAQMDALVDEQEKVLAKASVPGFSETGGERDTDSLQRMRATLALIHSCTAKDSLARINPEQFRATMTAVAAQQAEKEKLARLAATIAMLKSVTG